MTWQSSQDGQGEETLLTISMFQERILEVVELDLVDGRKHRRSNTCLHELKSLRQGLRAWGKGDAVKLPVQVLEVAVPGMWKLLGYRFWDGDHGSRSRRERRGGRGGRGRSSVRCR